MSSINCVLLNNSLVSESYTIDSGIILSKCGKICSLTFSGISIASVLNISESLERYNAMPINTFYSYMEMSSSTPKITWIDTFGMVYHNAGGSQTFYGTIHYIAKN